MKNKKGFTLIELLAVIVILGILLAIAIPNVSKYINSSRKDTFITNVQSYTKAARQESISLSNSYQLPVNTDDAIVITFHALEKAIESGGKTSPYGGTWWTDSNENLSYVVIVNGGTADNPDYKYYVAAIDSKGYAIGDPDTTSSSAILDKDLKQKNVVHVGANAGISYEDVTKTGKPLAGKTIKYVYSYAHPNGVEYGSN